MEAFLLVGNGTPLLDNDDDDDDDDDDYDYDYDYHPNDDDDGDYHPNDDDDDDDGDGDDDEYYDAMDDPEDPEEDAILADNLDDACEEEGGYGLGEDTSPRPSIGKNRAATLAQVLAAFNAKRPGVVRREAAVIAWAAKSPGNWAALRVFIYTCRVGARFAARRPVERDGTGRGPLGDKAVYVDADTGEEFTRPTKEELDEMLEPWKDDPGFCTRFRDAEAAVGCVCVRMGGGPIPALAK